MAFPLYDYEVGITDSWNGRMLDIPCYQLSIAQV